MFVMFLIIKNRIKRMPFHSWGETFKLPRISYSRMLSGVFV